MIMPRMKKNFDVRNCRTNDEVLQTHKFASRWTIMQHQDFADDTEINKEKEKLRFLQGQQHVLNERIDSYRKEYSDAQDLFNRLQDEASGGDVTSRASVEAHAKTVCCRDKYAFMLKREHKNRERFAQVLLTMSTLIEEKTVRNMTLTEEKFRYDVVGDLMRFARCIPRVDAVRATSKMAQICQLTGSNSVMQARIQCQESQRLSSESNSVLSFGSYFENLSDDKKVSDLNMSPPLATAELCKIADITCPSRAESCQPHDTKSLSRENIENSVSTRKHDVPTGTSAIDVDNFSKKTPQKHSRKRSRKSISRKPKMKSSFAQANTNLASTQFTDCGTQLDAKFRGFALKHVPSYSEEDGNNQTFTITSSKPMTETVRFQPRQVQDRMKTNSPTSTKMCSSHEESAVMSGSKGSLKFPCWNEGRASLMLRRTQSNKSFIKAPDDKPDSTELQSTQSTQSHILLNRKMPLLNRCRCSAIVNEISVATAADTQPHILKKDTLDNLCCHDDEARPCSRNLILDLRRVLSKLSLKKDAGPGKRRLARKVTTNPRPIGIQKQTPMITKTHSTWVRTKSAEPHRRLSGQGACEGAGGSSDADVVNDVMKGLMTNEINSDEDCSDNVKQNFLTSSKKTHQNPEYDSGSNMFLDNIIQEVDFVNSATIKKAKVKGSKDTLVIAIRAYDALNRRSHLSFKEGQIIHMLRPADEFGLAYGWAKSGKLFSLRKKGYFPIECVKEMQSR